MLRTTARALALALERVLPAIERRNCIPILGMARLRTEGGVLTVSGTNLDMQIDAEATIEPVGPSDELALDPRVLVRLCRALPRLEIVELVADGQGGVLTWNGGRCRVQGLSPGDWPELTLGERVAGSRTEAPVGEALGRVMRYVSREEVRYYLNGVCVSHHDGAGFLVATDGHRLGAVPGGGSLTAITQDLPGGNAIVPHQVLPQWQWMAARGDVEMTFHDSPALEPRAKLAVTRCVWRADGLAVRSKMIDGAYPDWSRVVPTVGRTVTARKGRLMQAAQLVAAGVSRETRHGLLKADGERLQLQLKSLEFEAAVDVCPASETFERSIDLRYLNDALHAVRGASVTIGLEGEDTSPGGPMSFTGSDAEPGEVHLVMPTRDPRGSSFQAPPRVEADAETVSEAA